MTMEDNKDLLFYEMPLLRELADCCTVLGDVGDRSDDVIEGEEEDPDVELKREEAML